MVDEGTDTDIDPYTVCTMRNLTEPPVILSGVPPGQDIDKSVE